MPIAGDANRCYYLEFGLTCVQEPLMNVLRRYTKDYFLQKDAENTTDGAYKQRESFTET